MNSKNGRPIPENGNRTETAYERRRVAASFSTHFPKKSTQINNDETDLEEEHYPICFTKGLIHDEFGILLNPSDYETLRKSINQLDATDFEHVEKGISTTQPAKTKIVDPDNPAGKSPQWRGWESPRTGHYFDLQGPDADAVSMPPAPALGSDELAAEMGEVYALALLRDVPFDALEKSITVTTDTNINSIDVLSALQDMTWFSSNDPGMLTLQQRRRRAARRIDHGSDFPIDDPPDNETFDTKNAFRGSAPRAQAGPYVSQFMLQGNKMDRDGPNHYTGATISYGRQVIDQKIETFTPGRDYMLHWNAFLDVQNGADFSGENLQEHNVQSTRRFITTPRDLATYVRYDALYQAYLNACLFMLESEAISIQRPVIHRHTLLPGVGFPDKSPQHARQAFASFGPPHILSLVTEVATRCLKAVRRQKFNYHRRARPERLGALFTLAASDTGKLHLGPKTLQNLNLMTGSTPDVAKLSVMLDLVHNHNTFRLGSNTADVHLLASSINDPDWFTNATARNYLLPMAFTEGSPMHPSYGAGHATVAGGCVTILKAFFDTLDDAWQSKPWPGTVHPVVESSDAGERLSIVPEGARTEGMTISGELNKLAANISIGRNMAGVHFYTDYYESLRMGERIATGMLVDQMRQYNEPMEMDFESFDGDHVHLSKIDYDYSDARIYIHDAQNQPVSFEDWWLRHLTDLQVSALPSEASKLVHS